MKKRISLKAVKKPVVIFALLFLIGGMLFYWYEYRPSMIREKCSAIAEKISPKDEYVYEICYRHCLRSLGIEYPARKE